MDKSPDAFRTISEVAEALATPAHVLRFWETRFPQIRPVKRAGGRRYYRPADVALLSGIRRLLHDEGMTIRGVQKILREQGVRHVAGLTPEVAKSTGLDAYDALLQPPNPEPVANPPAQATIIPFTDAIRPQVADADLSTPPSDDVKQPEIRPVQGDLLALMQPETDPSPPLAERTMQWLPTLIRALPPGALANRQGPLVRLHGRLAAVHQSMTKG